MRVKFIQPLFTGTRSYAKGELADLNDERAKRVIEGGHAVPVAAADQTLETATLKDKNETAAVKTAAKGK